MIVETEFEPAVTVGADATARLGLRVDGGDEIEGVLAVKLPDSLKKGNTARVDGVELRWATYELDAAAERVRWPQTGWLKGDVDDLADAIEHLSLSGRRLARSTKRLERVVQDAATQLSQHAGQDALQKIAATLHQSTGEQTERMTAAICVSAFVFHAAIEKESGIPNVPDPGEISRQGLLATWSTILDINYWPIFNIARNVVKTLPISAVPPVMDRIAESLSDLTQLGATTYHDLTGRMFQTLITDRKFLATFYTLPTSACLLAEMAVERLDVDWSDQNAIERLRIADFACGTGALLSAAQRAVQRRHRRAGGDDKKLHAALMERVLTGLDIMPAATHLTCSMLSSAHPSRPYGETSIHTMDYGVDADGEPHIGALDLLDSGQSYSLFATAETHGGTDAQVGSAGRVILPHESCDLVIMNPPFTRPTNHASGHANIPIPSFAGFGTSRDKQKAMSRQLSGIKKLFGHGNAGLASNFLDLAHWKLKDGGVLAAVLPFTFARGAAWEKARRSLKAHYTDIHVTSILATGSTERAFSADTGMAECLLIATKRDDTRSTTKFSNLQARPRSLLEAAVQAKRTKARAVSGDILRAGSPGVQSDSVIEAASGLEMGNLRLPRQTQVVGLPIVPLSAVAERGLVHRDISGDFPARGETELARGPFTVHSIDSAKVPTWPMLWWHNAARERRLVVPCDSYGVPRPGDKERARRRWNRGASRLHSNLDFRLNSQSLAMCLTAEKCLGGTAWPNVVPKDKRYETPLTLWCNSTLGLLLFWWKGTRQQAGRSRMTITTILDLPVLDPRTLLEDQLDCCRAIFDDLKDRDFLPANEAYRDEVRKDLDRQLLLGITSVLQLPAELEEGLDLLRQQWCAEPSVHGGKSTRIPVPA